MVATCHWSWLPKYKNGVVQWCCSLPPSLSLSLPLSLSPSLSLSLSLHTHILTAVPAGRIKRRSDKKLYLPSYFRPTDSFPPDFYIYRLLITSCFFV